MAEVFLSTVEGSGYQGMLYSSKKYLENIWMDTKYDIWLAHYTENTDFEGKYKIWQICDNGKVDGIEGTVDIDILFE
jgi:GH25 family lysozyme M1 (1,4-beta-N-acetylmuramidase)